jgi:excisionase family DNA binding protein
VLSGWLGYSANVGERADVENQWLTAIEAAQYLRVKHRTILKWAKQGTIPAHALSGCKRVTWRFLKSELDSAMLNPASAAGSGGSIEQQN